MARNDWWHFGPFQDIRHNDDEKMIVVDIHSICNIFYHEGQTLRMVGKYTLGRPLLMYLGIGLGLVFLYMPQKKKHRMYDVRIIKESYGWLQK